LSRPLRKLDSALLRLNKGKVYILSSFNALRCAAAAQLRSAAAACCLLHSQFLLKEGCVTGCDS